MTQQRPTWTAPCIGLVYLLVVAGLIGLSVGAYRKELPWQHSVEVSLIAPSAGLELNPQSDVKLNGLIIGQVNTITSDGWNATVHLQLDPDLAELVPASVDASIVPKTLFGEKYVNLIRTPGPAGPALAKGAVIRPSGRAVEIGELYTNLEGVLRTLRPDQLSLALGSLAQALQGRGQKIGNTAQLLDTYLAEFNPQLPTLVDDIRQLGAASDIYAAAAPNLLRSFDNTGAISAELLVPREQPLATFLEHAGDATRRLTDLAHRAGSSVVELTARADPVLDVLARYSPEYPCLFDTLNVANIAADHVLGGEGPYLTASIDLVTQQQPYTYPLDLPSSPHSAGNNDNLPLGVPSWAPHCTAIPSQLQGIRDVTPYALATRVPVAPTPTGRGGTR